MKIGLMQPYLFPYLGYFQLMNAVDTYVIYDDVQFIKGGWINRNNILIGGQKVLFTVRLNGASPNKLINEITIEDNFSKLLKTIAMAYSRAPYCESVSRLLERICAYEDKNLALFAGNSLQEISHYLGLGVNFKYSSSLAKDTSLKAQDKVIAICKELDGDTYINAIGGQELYGQQDFQQNKLKLQFLKPHLEEYPQLGKPFVPGLSIIDIMMFNNPDQVRDMLNNYELI